MKTIGLLGGMSWESTREYYELLNTMARDHFGGSHSCPCIIHSFDFAEINALQHQDKWDEMARLLIKASVSLESSGAELLMIGTNTMHLLADQIEKSIDIPLVHIADAVAEPIKKRELKKIALLGTRFTMEKPFYANRLKKKHGISSLVPDENDRKYIHRVIYEELIKGVVKDDSRNGFLKIIDRLTTQGAEGVILGCTEIPLLVKQEHCQIPVLDSTSLHAKAAFEMAIK